MVPLIFQIRDYGENSSMVYLFAIPNVPANQNELYMLSICCFRTRRFCLLVVVRILATSQAVYGLNSSSGLYASDSTINRNPSLTIHSFQRLTVATFNILPVHDSVFNYFMIQAVHEILD